MIPIVRRMQVRAVARDDAKHGNYKVWIVIVQFLGDRPGVDAEKYHDHATMLTNQTGVTADDAREAVAGLEQSAAGGNLVSPALITGGVIVAVLFESLGGTYLMSSFDMSNGQRIGAGIAFGVGLLLFTAMVARRANASHDKASISRSAGTLVALVLYSIVLLAIVGMRVMDAEAGDNRMQTLVQAIALLVVTMAPPWLTEFLMRQRAQSGRLHTELNQLRRTQREATRDRDRARTSLQKISRESESWDREARRLKAVYDSEFTSTRARLGLPPVAAQSPSDGGDDIELSIPTLEGRRIR